MTEETTDNKVEEIKNPDAPRMTHEVEDIIAREEAAKQPEEGVTPEETPEPETPDWQVKHSEMETQLAEMQEKYSNLENRYSGSSDEGKRLAAENERLKSQDEYLRNNYDLGPLLEGYEAPVVPEEQPITRADLERWQIETEWRGAEEGFFSHADNKDVAENPMMREMVKRWIFDDGGQYLRYPDASPFESFTAAAREVRNAMAGERLRGKEEVLKTRTELEQAAIVEGEGTQPVVPDNKETEEVSGEDSYVEIWKKNKQRIQGDM